MTRRIILIDVDHVLANAFWRDAMIASSSWDDYHAAGENDVPLPDGITLANALALAGCHVIALTGRPEKWRGQTTAWLVRHGVVVHELLMRGDKDHRPSPEVKYNTAIDRFGLALSANVAMVIDDREDVLEKFRAAGVTTLLVRARPR